jgi:hypothetical protein
MSPRLRLRWPFLLIVTLFGLYEMKAAVEARERALHQLQRAVADEREALQILRAEWAYLNQPERLARLAQAKLGLQPAAAAQFARLDHLPTGLIAETALATPVAEPYALRGERAPSRR